jgi:ankyrin repeat protein
LEAVKVLLDNNADVMSKDDFGQTALHFAARHRYSYALVKLLLDAKADVNGRDNLSQTPLHSAANYQSLEPRPTPADVISKDDMDFAAMLMALGRVKLFHGKSDVNGRDESEIALQTDSLWGVKALLDNKADVTAQDNLGRTALHQAAEEGNWELVKILIDRNADIDARDSCGRTPLHCAGGWLWDDSEALIVIETLLDAGADITARDDTGGTALHCAAAEILHKGVTKALLEAKADITAQDNMGRTALHLAAGTGNLEAVKELLEAKADIVTVLDKGGMTVLHLAAKALIWRDSDRVSTVVNVVKALLDAKVDITVQDKEGKTALYFAMMNENSEEVVKVLLDANADEGKTPLC